MSNKLAVPICVNSKSGRGGQPNLQPSLQDRIYRIDGKSPAIATSFMHKVAIPLKEVTDERSNESAGSH